MQKKSVHRTEEPAVVVGQLVEMAGYRERLRSLRELRLPPSADLAAALSARARLEIRRNPAAAGEWARLAAEVARQITDTLLWIDARRVLARSCMVRGNFKAALRVLRVACGAARAVGDGNLGAELVALRIQALGRLEQYAEAEELGRRTLEGFPGESGRSGAIRVHMALADLACRRDAPDEALLHYARVDEIRASGSAGGPAATAPAGEPSVFEAPGRSRGELLRFEAVRAPSGSRGAEHVIAQLDYNAARADMTRGRYRDALDRLAATAEVFARFGDDRRLAFIALDRAEIHAQLCLFEDAHRSASDAERRFSSLGLTRERAEAVRLSGVAKENQGDLAGAERKLREAAELFGGLGLQERRICCRVHGACVAERAGRIEAAEKIAVEAEALLDPEKSPLTTATLGLLRARLALRRDNPDLAHRMASVVADGMRSALAPLIQIEALMVMGLADRLRGRLRAAISAYRKAIDLHESHLVGVPPDEYMAPSLAARSELYGEIVDLLVTAGDLEAAFTFAERAKSRALVDFLARGERQSGRELPVSHSRRLNNLRERLSAVHQRLHAPARELEARSFRLLRKARREATELERKLSNLLRDARIHEVEAASLGSVNTLDIATIRRGLGDDTAILEYLLTGSRLFVFVLTKTELHVVRQEVDAEKIREALERFRSDLQEARITGPEAEGPSMESIRGTLDRMGRLLLDPVERHLESRRLLIIPHGMLHRLPFHALPWRDGWLVDRFEVLYAPSATVHGFCAGREPTARGPAAVFGPPDGRSPEVEEEARTVAEVLGSERLYLREEATLERLREEARRSRIVHIGTHGASRPAQPAFSSIPLSGGWADLYDLYGLEIRGELVVLASPENGGAEESAGDEGLGLTRALLFAGAPALLTSRWPTSDAVATKFMRRFYLELEERGEAGEAYRATICALRRAHPHPYFWAPFFLTGRPVERAEEERGAAASTEGAEARTPLVKVRA